MLLSTFKCIVLCATFHITVIAPCRYGLFSLLAKG